MALNLHENKFNTWAKLLKAVSVCRKWRVLYESSRVAPMSFYMFSLCRLNYMYTSPCLHDFDRMFKHLFFRMYCCNPIQFSAPPAVGLFPLHKTVT